VVVASHTWCNAVSCTVAVIPNVHTQTHMYVYIYIYIYIKLGQYVQNDKFERCEIAESLHS
jgi:hypothetical protein